MVNTPVYICEKGFNVDVSGYSCSLVMYVLSIIHFLSKFTNMLRMIAFPINKIMK